MKTLGRVPLVGACVVAVARCLPRRRMHHAVAQRATAIAPTAPATAPMEASDPAVDARDEGLGVVLKVLARTVRYM